MDEKIVANGIVQKRLMLPEGTPCIDAYPGLPTVRAVEQVVVFDDIYPKTKGNISSVSTYEKTVENEDDSVGNEDGAVNDEDGGVENGDEGKTTETFYRFTDTGFNFSQEYILEGEELRIVFQSGSLNGMDFGVMFNPEAAPEKLEDGSWNPDAQLWEIVANEDYGRKLPDNVLKPKEGDTYILYGWDSTRIEGLGLVAEAEEELKKRAEAYIRKTRIDPNTYSCKMMPDYMYGLDADGNQNPNYAKHFDVGDKVNLINKAFFETGSRSSRIIGYEYNLDKPYDNPVFTVGETAAYSRIGELESKLDNITLKGQTYTGGGGRGGIYVIGTNDSTAPSNRNVYSALKALQSFINKTRDDRSTGKIASDTALEVGKFVSGATGGIFLNDKETGQSSLEVDKLHVRMKAYFESLEIVNVNSVGGKQVISPAGGVRLAFVWEKGLVEVERERQKTDDEGNLMTDEKGNPVMETYTEKVDNGVPEGVYRCFFLAEQDGQEVENRYKKDDQVLSKDFNIKKPGQYNKVTNHYYWRLVTGVSTEPVTVGGLGYHYVDLSVTDCDTGSDAPAAGDVIAHLGNRTDVDRQNALVFSSVDTFSPSITLYQGINSYSYLGKDVVSYGVNKTSNKAFFNVYGEMYVGDREGNTFIKYTQDNGVEIKGKLAVGTRIGDEKTIEDALKEATQSAIDSANENISEFTNAITKDIEGLQNQIDGAIETWFDELAPTLESYPANEWTTVEAKNLHLGDLYYSGEGKAYRFQMDGEDYVWKEITDSDITKALANAKKAQDTADGKRKVFVKQPTDADEYDIGDLWVNATYGTIYKNDMLRAVKAKESGVAFDISHWTKASKYTDDTKADQVQENVDTLSTSVNSLSNTVSGMKDFTDTAFADGIVDRSEKSAIKNYLNNIETTKADVRNAYEKVYDNALLEGVAKTNLSEGYEGFNAAAKELVDTVTEAIKDGKTTSAERANVDAKYTNFNTKYGEFVAYLNAANKYIQDKINSAASEALTQIGGLSYLKKALKEDTSIEGGLIQSSVLALGYTLDDGAYKVMSGTNGIYESSKRGGGIASWWGGSMKDRDDYTGGSVPSDAAKALIRMDGSGYLADGGIWWGTDGKIHADPQSFIIRENQLGDYLELFRIVYKTGSPKIDYMIPQYVMQKLEVATELKLGGVPITRHADGVLEIGGDLLVTGSVTMYAQGAHTASSILDALPIDSVTLSKEGGKLKVIGGGGGGSSISGIRVNGGTYAPDADGYITVPDYPTSLGWSDITGKPTSLSGFGIADGVNAVSVTGSGNVVTAASVSGHTLTLTKGITALTAHQSLANYVTLNSAQTISGAKTFSAAPSFTASSKPFNVSSTALVGNLNADLLDSLHASAFARADQQAAVDLNTVNGHGIMCNATNAAATAERHYPVSEAGTLFYGTAVHNSANQIYGTYNSNRWFVRGGGTSTTAKTAWRELLHTGNYSTTLDTRYYTESEINTKLTNGSVTKLGTSTVGSGTKPIYLNAGTATASGSTVGSTSKPVYMSAGAITALSATVGSSSLPVYMSSGTITQCSTSLGVSITGNAASATKLQTARTLWGQSFNGTANVTGAMSSVTSITMSGALSGATTGSFSSTLSANGTTDATSLTSASLVCKGGAAITKNLLVGGAITMYYTSDMTLKDNIRPVKDAPDRLMSLGGVYDFEYSREEVARNPVYGGRHTGLMYQNVKDSALGSMAHKRSDGKGVLNYLDPSFICLIAAVGMNHEERIRELEKENVELKKRISDLERRAA